ncbi:hypothetical protein [Tessaracoccus sp.]
MSVFMTRNPTVEVDAVAAELAPPMRADGSPYRFEMRFSGDTRRVFADTVEDLLNTLSPNYAKQSPAGQLASRLHLAVQAQTKVQSWIAFDLLPTVTATPNEQAVLLGHRNTPPDPDQWNCPIPLLLVDVYYRPLGELLAPLTPDGDVAEPANVWWIRPTDPFEFLISLHNIGFIALAEHADWAV